VNTDCAPENGKKRRSLTFLTPVTNLFTARFNFRSILFFIFYCIVLYSILFYSQKVFLFFIKFSEQAYIFSLH